MHNATSTHNISFQVVQVAIPIFLSFNKVSIKRKILFDTKYAKPGKRGEGINKRDVKKHKNRVTRTLDKVFPETSKKSLTIYSLCQHLFRHFRHLLVIHMSQQQRFSLHWKLSVNIHNFCGFYCVTRDVTWTCFHSQLSETNKQFSDDVNVNNVVQAICFGLNMNVPFLSIANVMKNSKLN